MLSERPEPGVIVYTFQKGEGLPLHVHTEADNHTTYVETGSVYCWGPAANGNKWEIEVSAGRLIRFRPEEPHEITALEDNTRIRNVRTQSGGAT